MPQQAWNNKRERQYEHIKEGLEERGRDEDTAEEIAARTVNKERARSGEADQKSRTSTDDISSGPARRAPVAPGLGRSDQGAALQRGEGQGRRRAARRCRRRSSRRPSGGRFPTWVTPTSRGEPDENEAERLTRNLNELLQELRVTQTGIQILTGFLLTLPFSQRFKDLDALQRGTFLAILDRVGHRHRSDRGAGRVPPGAVPARQAAVAGGGRQPVRAGRA